MLCPYCGKEMIHGNLTGNKMLRLMPDPETPKKVHHYSRNLPPSQYENGLEGILLDVPYTGLALWVPADYCRECKKVIFDAEILRGGDAP